MADPRNKINRALGKMVFNRYFDEIPMDEIFEIVNANGCEIVDEEGNRWSGMLFGENSNCTFDVIGINRNSHYLYLSWYTMQSGRYEIVAYVS